MIPRHLWGNYDVPGWTANGIEPWGLQLDPIAAGGNLFYRGFFSVMLAIRSLLADDDRWNRPFDLIGDGANTFTWTHSAIVEHLEDQWRRHPEGCQCDNTKIWPV